MVVLKINTLRIKTLFQATHTSESPSHSTLVIPGALIQTECAFCKGSIKGYQDVAICPVCFSVYHIQCLKMIISSPDSQDIVTKDGIICIACGEGKIKDERLYH